MPGDLDCAQIMHSRLEGRLERHTTLCRRSESFQRTNDKKNPQKTIIHSERLKRVGVIFSFISVSLIAVQLMVLCMSARKKFQV